MPRKWSKKSLRRYSDRRPLLPRGLRQDALGRKSKRFLLCLAIVYTLICAAAFLGQRSFLYFPPSNYITPKSAGLSTFTEVPLEMHMPTADTNIWLTAWWAPPSVAEGKIVMVFHGNGSAVFSNTDIYHDLITAGHGVWVVAYPGYPGSTGTPNQAKIIRAARLQYDAILARNKTGADIVFYGTSLGSGVAAQLAAQVSPDLLIMDAPFNSVLDMAQIQMPFLPVRMLLKDKFKSDMALRGQNMPLIWLHGTHDAIVPLSQGQKLYDGYTGPKTAHIIKEGQHTNLWYLGGRDVTLAALKE